MNTFTIKTKVFEGPLELLLHLIEKRKLHVSDISLAAVTDDYISYLESHPNRDVGESAHFIWVASTLLLIKSKALLPTLELSEEEQGDIEDLEARLRLYKRFRMLSRHVQNTFGKQVLFAREEAGDREPVFSPDKSLSLARVESDIKQVLHALPKVERMVQAVVEKVISLEEMIDSLGKRITDSISLSFKDFAEQGGKGGREEKLNVIVSFLAMLELVKRGMMAVRQEARFGDITMETEEVGTPRY